MRGEKGDQGEQEMIPSLLAIARDAEHAIVCVTTGLHLCSTGFYVDSAGTVMTAAHVLELNESRQEIMVVNSVGYSRDYTAWNELSDIDAVYLRL